MQGQRPAGRPLNPRTTLPMMTSSLYQGRTNRRIQIRKWRND